MINPQGNLFKLQIDGKTVFHADQKDQLKSALPDFFAWFISEVHHWGDEGIKQLLDTALWLAQEMKLGKRKIQQLEGAISFFKRENALQLIFNEILTYEGHSNLTGFGVGTLQCDGGKRKVLVHPYVNPERQSVHLAAKDSYRSEYKLKRMKK